jgi:hypothetical protein
VVNSIVGEKIEQQIAEVATQYHRLVLVAGPLSTGKTVALRELAEKHSWPLISVNRELSERMLVLTPKQRALRVGELMRELVDETNSDVVLLDNVEILFHTELAQDPLRLLQGLARNRTVVVGWLGIGDASCLTYGEPGHAEFRRYDRPDAAIVSTGDVKG